MKAMLERNAAQLTPGEQQAVWEKVSSARTVEARTNWNWALPAAVAAAGAMVVIVVVGLQPQPGSNSHPAKPQGVEPPATAARVAPGAEPVRAGANRREQRAIVVTPPTAGGATAAPVPDLIVLRSRPATTAPVTTGLVGSLTGRVLDAQRRPVPYANVMVEGTHVGAMTDENGEYRIDRLPPATYTLRVQAQGYARELREGVQVGGEHTASADILMRDQQALQIKEVEVSADRRVVETKMSATLRSISAEKLRSIPVDNLQQVVRSQAGIVAQGDALHFRGGRGGEVKYQFDGVSGTAERPPVVPTTGGTRLPNGEAFDSMFFKNHGVNPFIATDEDALSTFAVDVDAASYTIARRYLGLGELPPADAVRVEEFVNFFEQGYPHFENDDFRILADGAPSPFGPGYQLVRIGIKGREIAAQDRKPARLTFVIDVSGSMDRENRLELVKRALRLLVGELRGDDCIGIVVFGTTGRELLQPLALDGPPSTTRGFRFLSDRASKSERRERILAAIDQLHPEGSTNTADGLKLGYEMARRAYQPGAINRIVLCSDGVANTGQTGPAEMLAQVRTEADRGIALTTIGFGMGNYNDVLMEHLADKGDGNYYYVDNLDEARRVFVEHLSGTLQTIAKDAKVQVEFDSTRVLRYRLLGFENRDVADRDFRNDKVDAGEIGAGHEVTALYEVKLAPHVAPGVFATVRLRYARPDQEAAGAPQVREIAQRVEVAALAQKFEDAAPHFRLDAAVAEFAEILRGSYWAKEGRLSDVLSVARGAAAELHDPAAAELVSLVEKAAVLKAKPAGSDPGR